MTVPNKKYCCLRVVSSRMYVFESGLNGWTTEQVVQDWFHDHPLSRAHATRDAYRVGGSEKVLHVEMLEDLDAEQAALAPVTGAEIVRACLPPKMWRGAYAVRLEQMIDDVVIKARTAKGM